VGYRLFLRRGISYSRLLVSDCDVNYRDQQNKTDSYSPHPILNMSVDFFFHSCFPFSKLFPLPVILVLILIALLHLSLNASVLQIWPQITSDDTDYTSVLQRLLAIRGHYVWQSGRHISWALSAMYASPLCDQPWC
jgi:hypothetical protein